MNNNVRSGRVRDGARRPEDGVNVAQVLSLARSLAR